MNNYFGIDISKRHFDVYNLLEKKHKRFDNDSWGIKKCLKLLTSQYPALVAMENTGGYEVDLAMAIDHCGLPVAVVNPKRIRDFARSCGKLAKTDKIDARIIAQYASVIKPPPRGILSEHMRALKDMVVRRNQLVKTKNAESNRLEHASNPAVSRSIKAMIKVIDRELRKIEGEINGHIKNCPDLQLKMKRIASMPGIAETTASMLIAEVPELGNLNRRQISALIGLAPINRDSGTFRGKRMTGGGRKNVRCKLFMPALVAIKHNPTINSFYNRLLARGKTKMTAIVACMRKIIITLNAMLFKNQAWTQIPS